MSDVTRRDLLNSAALVGGWLTLGGIAMAQTASKPTGPADEPATAAPDGPYALPPLPYDFADLEPHLDAQTVKLHHDVHHAGYVRGANEALGELEHIRRVGGDTIKEVRAVTDKLTFNLAGHRLHSIYWNNMRKDGGGEPSADSEIAKLLKRDFGIFEAFAAQFSAAAAQVQGSGWAILGYEPLAQRLIITLAEKHQNAHGPGVVPLLAIDVWEHAYYLKYQNRRTGYIKAFFNLINWADVDKNLREGQRSLA